MSLTVLLLRLYIRRTVLGQFKADDYLVAAAWICFCAVSITWSILGKDLYAAIDADTSSLTTVSRLVSYLKEYAQALHANLGTYFSTWTSLYLVKLSFMVFFRGLGNKIKTQTILWWCVLAFIIASYAVSVGMFDYGCLTADWAHIIGKLPDIISPSSQLNAINSRHAVRSNNFQRSSPELTSLQCRKMHWHGSPQLRICNYTCLNNSRCGYRCFEYVQRIYLIFTCLVLGLSGLLPKSPSHGQSTFDKSKLTTRRT